MLSALLAKDLRLEVRTRDVLAATATVALLVALASNIAFADNTAAPVAVAGGWWIGITFGAQLGLARSFVIERDRGTLEGILASPAGPLAVFASKLIVHGIVVLTVAIGSAVALFAFFAVPYTALTAPLLLVALLGILGIALATTLASAMAMHGRNWVLLVPLLTLPALFPVLAAAIPATEALLGGAPLAAIDPHVRILVAYDVSFAVAAWLLAPFLIEP